MLVPGMVYSHEHIPIDLSEVKKNEDCLLDSQGLVIKEFQELYKKGIRNVISLTNIGMGRNVEYARLIEEKTNINIVQCTGYYQEKFFPVEVFKLSTNQLAERMIEDILQGIKGTDIKAGVIGEIGTSYNRFTDAEKKVFDASIIAHNETECPISTHASMGTMTLEQVRYLQKQKVDLSKVIIGHTDLITDVKYLEELLKSGVNIGFDTIGKEGYMSDNDRMKMLKIIQNLGRIDQVTMSMDISRKSYLKENGGRGYCYLIDSFIPRLLHSGITEEAINKMMILNPQRIFGLND